MQFIGIAGKSGAGKSTLAYALLDAHPQRVNILHLDDFMKKTQEVDFYEGYPNFDEPAAIRFDDMVSAMRTLLEGQPVTVRTKSERINPDYKTRGRIPYEVLPRDILILEGYLALYDKRVRDMLHFSFFLDLDAETSKKRRTKHIKQGYEERVLLPMQQMYVEPTKHFADVVLLAQHDAHQVYEKTASILYEKRIL